MADIQSHCSPVLLKNFSHSGLWEVAWPITYSRQQLLRCVVSAVYVCVCACWYVIRSRCPIRKGCDITRKVVSLLAPGKRNLFGNPQTFVICWILFYTYLACPIYLLATHTHTTKKQKPTHLLSVSSFFCLEKSWIVKSNAVMCIRNAMCAPSGDADSYIKALTTHTYTLLGKCC